MREHELAVWDGDSITMLAHYDWPAPHDTQYRAVKCYPKDKDCDYWVAADGQCYGLKASGQSCIAVIEQMVQSAGAIATYVTFAGKDRSDAAWKRWEAKWSKRTINADKWDSSVRVSA